MNRISVFTLPVLVVGVLALGGCSRTKEVQIPVGGTYVSTSGGASFAQSVRSENAPNGHIANFDVGKIHRSSKDSATVFMAAGQNGMVISHDDGNTWAVVKVPLVGVVDVIQAKTGALLAAGVDENAQGLVYRSFDEGKTWESVLKLPIAQEKKRFQLIGGGTPGPASVVALEADINHPDIIWAGTNDGSIFAGEQSGKTWKKVVDITSHTSMITGDKTGAGVIRLIPSPTNTADVLIVTQDKRLLQLKDGVLTELRIPESLDATTPFGVSISSQKVLSAAYVPGFPNALLVGTTTGVVATRDAGKTWVALQLPLDASKTLSSVSVVTSPTNAGRIFVATDGVVFRSEDSGASWHMADVSPVGYEITDISINPKNAARMIAVVKALVL